MRTDRESFTDAKIDPAILVRPTTPPKEIFYDGNYQLEQDNEMQQKIQSW